MTEYRKSTRAYYAFEGNNVLRIVNRESLSEVCSGDNKFILLDAKEAKPCTEQEFKEQLQLAMERIQTLKIS